MGNKVALSPLVTILFLKHSVHELYGHSEPFTNVFSKIEEKSLESKSVILCSDCTIHVESARTHTRLKGRVLRKFSGTPSPRCSAVCRSCACSWLDWVSGGRMPSCILYQMHLKHSLGNEGIKKFIFDVDNNQFCTATELQGWRPRRSRGRPWGRKDRGISEPGRGEVRGHSIVGPEHTDRWSLKLWDANFLKWVFPQILKLW